MPIGAKSRHIEPDITVVELSGHLNLGNNLVSIESFIKQLLDGGARKVAIEVSALTYIDSAGVGMLVGANGHMDALGGRMCLCGAQGGPAKVFETVHMSRILRLDADLDAACAYLSSSQAAG